MRKRNTQFTSALEVRRDNGFQDWSDLVKVASRISLDYIFFQKEREEKRERRKRGEKDEGRRGEERGGETLPIKAAVSIHGAWTACPFNVGKGWTMLVV